MAGKEARKGGVMIRRLHEAKAMARSLRDALHKRELVLSHGDLLEIVAEELGLKDWHRRPAGAAVLSEPDVLSEAAVLSEKPRRKSRAPRFHQIVPIFRIFSLEK